jgi:hypothetical protein
VRWEARLNMRKWMYRDQTHHADGTELSPGERESRMQIYLAAVSRAGRRAVRRRRQRIIWHARHYAFTVVAEVTVYIVPCACRQVMELADWVVPACTTAPLVGELNPANTPFSPHPLYGESVP